MDVPALIAGMPKAELHIHLESALSAEQTLEIAQRNGLDLPYRTADELRAAYEFDDLQSFLEMFWLGLGVLRTRADFFELGWTYLRSAREQNIVRAECFCTPQAHLYRGIPFDDAVGGILEGLEAGAKEFGVSARLIIGFQRHRSEDECFEIYRQALPYRDALLGVGLASAEVGNPPSKFARLFAECRKQGWRTVAHAGEEGPASYVAEAIDVLGVERIDHGVRCEEDPALVERLAASGIGLTVCPISNVKLRVFDRLEHHNLKRLLDKGVRVTVNCDNVREFGANANDNYVQCHAALGLSIEDLFKLARNSLLATFMPDDEKRRAVDRLDRYRASLD